MRTGRSRSKSIALFLGALMGCDSCEDDTSCSVAQVAEGVSIRCADGSDATIPTSPTEPCSVTQADDEITFSCPDGSAVTLPVSGSDSCDVSKDSDGSFTISCPDGSSAVIPPPPDGTPFPLVHFTGATSTACGACHDSEANEVHFATMTVRSDGIPVEDCATCHEESGIKAVSAVHARPELGPPGFEVQILGASIDSSSRRATVRLRIQDSAGNPLTRSDVSSNFVIGSVAPETPVGGSTPVAGPYASYITRTATQVDNPDYPLDGAPRVVQQPTSESDGTYTNPGPGLFDYTFAAALPSGYPANLTHVISHYSTRTVGDVRWVSNDSYFFVPAGGAAAPLQRQVVRTETCNSCHAPLSAHGGSRQEVQLCLGCHSEGAVDPESNNSLDLNVMVHRIHMGAALPSVKAGKPYGIVGRNNETADFSHVGYPQDVVHCQSCHTDNDDDRWVTNGKPEVCLACHDDVYEADAHPFELAPGAVCGNGACHGPSGSAPDAREAHRTFLNSDAPIFDISIVSAEVADADSAPALRISALTGTRLSGALLPVASVDSFSTLNVFFNGPNRDFALNGHDIKQYDKASLVELDATATPGEFVFSLPETLREMAGSLGDVTEDSYTLGIRAAYDPTPSASPDDDRVDMTKNPTVAISAAGTATGRGAVVDTQKCNACHGDLRAHGGDILARNVEECIMCHTASLETSPRQAANLEPGPTTSLRFSQLVHRIHAGGSATEPYVVYGYAAAPPYPEVDFSARLYPGDARACGACHLDGTYYVPLAASPSATQTLVLDDAGQPIKQ
jgi:OmcA/MtrC family decaheme c-type cytochrome